MGSQPENRTKFCFKEWSRKMNFNKSDNSIPLNPKNQKGPKKKGAAKRVLINLLVTAVVGFVYFYVELPALNFQNEQFYFFFFILSAVYCVSAIVTSGLWRLQGQAEFFTSVKNHCKVPIIICGAFLVLILFGTILSSVILRADAYSKLLPIQTGDFATEVAEAEFDKIPMLDRDSAEQLGNRKLGELSDMVSQFEVSSENTQINYQGRPVRVTPLIYADLIKWFTNRSEGLPAYLVIDMVTQNVELVRLEEGMKYTPDEHFGRNLSRFLRFRYPTYMFDAATFEVDEKGQPYWVCPRLVKTIGLFGGRDIDGAVLVNAVTGDSQYFDAADVPTWVDRVFTAELIIEQYDYYGRYNKGFFNSIFGQKDVTVTTQGYNYLAMGDDVYVYTGVSSVGGDRSNVGFILTNQRTKETHYYKVAGAEEYSAMSSAQGVVQHLNYSATFPLLLNINGEPTYFMALKDQAGLVKMYAMVNVRQYQLVATGTTVAECEVGYKKLLVESNVMQEDVVSTTAAEGMIEELRAAVQDGNTFYYIKLDTSDSYYIVNAAEYPISVVLNVGDSVKINFAGTAGDELLAATTLERTKKAASPAPALVPPVQTAPVEDTVQAESMPTDTAESESTPEAVDEKNENSEKKEKSNANKKAT